MAGRPPRNDILQTFIEAREVGGVARLTDDQLMSEILVQL